MIYRVRMLVYHKNESANNAQGVECEFESRRNIPHGELRQTIAREYHKDGRFIKQLHVELVKCQ